MALMQENIPKQYDQIISRLAADYTATCVFEGRARAAVALILRQGANGMEMLFIQRSTHELDPWSGHLAFPGGRLEPGEEPRQAAEREVMEEISLDLSRACYLGGLIEISGRTLPVQVACFVYAVDGYCAEPVLNEEVYSAFWIRVSDLIAPERHVTATVHFDDSDHEVPAIQLPQANTPVLWGLTYRLVVQFLETCCDHTLPDDRKEW